MKNNSQLIMNITNMNDIEKLKQTTTIKYINLDLEHPNLEVIYYLIDHGKKYSYSDKIGDQTGIFMCHMTYLNNHSYSY